jgi:hypothetical protein
METITADEAYKVITKLIGPINPVGETHTDTSRFENLKVMTEVVDQLLTDIDRVASYHDRIEYSMKLAGQHACKFLDKIGIEN